MSAAADPFDTAQLRAATLAAWQSSPARFREDANAEEDLRFGAYRDRLFAELAQNAADAAGTGGRVAVSIVDVDSAGDEPVHELRIANTGAPLTRDGVVALASLRASAKRESGGVGRFGVGFSAVLAVSDAPRVVSRAGGVQFSAARTAVEVAALPELAEELAKREGTVAALRLVWPVADTELPPPGGYDTEVRLPLRRDVDAAALLAEFLRQAPDLLLALPGLREISCGEQTVHREDLEDGIVVIHRPDGYDRWAVHRAAGKLTEDQLSGLGTESRQRPEWTVCWAVPVDADGAPLPLGEDVVHAPTPTDERVSLPARLLATLPMESTRRRLAPGTATEAVLDAAAECYPQLLLAFAPEQRTRLVPLPEFPLSGVDDRLRALLVASLRVAAWLPTAGATLVEPVNARVLEVQAAGLSELLTETVDGLLPDEYSSSQHAKALKTLDVRRLGLGEVVSALSGADRTPQWWVRLYTALAPVAEGDPLAREELGALPVPLVDGRVVTGPRGTLLPDADQDLLDELSTVDAVGLRIVHPDAAHPLLERLGARRAGPAELLDAGDLRAAVERSVEDAEAGMDVSALADAVLMLADRAGLRPGERPWLAALALRDADGGPRRADELLLPGSPLLDVLDPQAPLGVLNQSVAERWPASLLGAVGVLDAFSVVVDENPTGPDHDLVDEEQWWDEVHATDLDAGAVPRTLVAVRDLDLVAEDRWPAALNLLAADPLAWRALREPNGYTAWWLARYAKLDGEPPRNWRLPQAQDLGGLYDVVPDVGLREELLALIGVRSGLHVADADAAAELLTRLADPDRFVREGVVLRAHAALADAVLADRFDPSDVDVPEVVRSVAGTVVEVEDAVVLDGPWWLGVLDPAEVVAGGDAEALADVLDLPVSGGGAVVSAGKSVAWAELDGVVEACDLLAVDYPDGELAVHAELLVRNDDENHRVAWWVDADERVHTTEDPVGLSRALAWELDRWPERHLIAALLTTPSAATLFQ